MKGARAQTDTAVRAMRQALSGTLARWSEQGDTPARLADFDAALDALGETRAGVDDGRLGRGGAADSYNYLIVSPRPCTTRSPSGTTPR